MHASDYLENRLVDHLFRTAAFPKPAALYVALFVGAPGDAGGGLEVTGAGYARTNHPPLDGNWTATQGGTAGASSGTGGTTTNATVVAFGAPSADWGTVTHTGLFDAATGGNLLAAGPLLTAREILAGDPAPRFPPGAFSVMVS